MANKTHPPLVPANVVERQAEASLAVYADSENPLAVLENLGDLPVEPEDFLVEISPADEAYALRMAGYSTKQISHKLSKQLRRVVSTQEVDTLISSIGRENVARTGEQLPFSAQLELDRIEEAVKAIWSSVQDGNLYAIDRLVKLSERKTRMLGLDSPDVSVQLRLGSPDAMDLSSLTTEELRTYQTLLQKASSASKQKVISSARPNLLTEGNDVVEE